jgi:transcriptional regulator with XRE-family HTH domain
LKVNERVRHIRKLKGLTQVTVAEKLDIPTQTYNSYELGRRKIYVELIKQIAEILDEPVENFFEDKIYETKNNSNLV